MKVPGFILPTTVPYAFSLPTEPAILLDSPFCTIQNGNRKVAAMEHNGFVRSPP